MRRASTEDDRRRPRRAAAWPAVLVVLGAWLAIGGRVEAASGAAGHAASCKCAVKCTDVKSCCCAASTQDDEREPEPAAPVRVRTRIGGCVNAAPCGEPGAPTSRTPGLPDRIAPAVDRVGRRDEPEGRLCRQTPGFHLPPTRVERLEDPPDHARLD